MPALVWIQTHLDGDLSLDALADVAELSPHHFHRRFRECVGETARQYVEQLRLEAWSSRVDSSRTAPPSSR